MRFAVLFVVFWLSLPGGIAAAAESVDQTAEAILAKLPGKTAFAFTELTSDGPKLLYGANVDERFAIGSSFKLFILATLADEVNADRRQLDNVMLLRANLEGPPHSEMADWPVGSPVTLHTLALKMISISDNTATDHLLYLFGPERVEEQMRRVGHGRPELNTPLLSTRQMTMLRDKHTGMLGREYLKLDVTARRKFLAEHCTGEPDYSALDFDTSAYDLAEWYASPMDMARTLGWIKSATEEGKPANPVRGILAMDPKLPHDAGTWPYVGFKGGSEDQLLAGNWLLKNKNGRWYTFHVYCNSPKEKVDQEAMISAVGNVFQLIEQALQGKSH